MLFRRSIFEAPDLRGGGWPYAVGWAVIAAALVIPPFFLGPRQTATYYFGVAILYGIVPKINRIPSPDGSCVVRTIFFDFRAVPLAVFPLALSFLPLCTGIGYFAIWLVSCYIGGFLCLLLWLGMIWALRFVSVRDVKRAKTLWRFLLLTGANESNFEATWLEDNRTVLVAFSGENYWLLMQWDTDASPLGGHKFSARNARGYAVIVGTCPPLQWIRYRDNHEWLEDLWVRYGIDPMNTRGSPSGARDSTSYANQVRRFFEVVLDWSASFPSRVLCGFRDEIDRKSRIKSCRDFLYTIPASSVCYREIREAADATLRKLEPLSAEEKNMDPEDSDLPVDLDAPAWTSGGPDYFAEPAPH